MTTAPLLLAAFLAVVVAGGALVAVHDAVERAWLAARTPAQRGPGVVRRGRQPRAAPPVAAWRHLH